MVGEALAYVQGANLKANATSLVEGFLTPRSPRQFARMQRSPPMNISFPLQRNFGIIIPILLLSLLILSMLVSRQLYLSQDRSQEEIDLVREMTVLLFDSGLVEIRENIDEFDRDGLYLNNKLITVESFIRFARLYPNKENPSILLTSSQCSGSACIYLNYYLIDLENGFVTDIPFSYPDGWIDDLTIREIKSGIYLIEAVSLEKDKIGDMIPVQIEYNRSEKLVRLLNTKNPTARYSEYIGHHPSDLLSGESSRALFLSEMSEPSFKKLREYMNGPGNISSEGHQGFIIGRGMAAHMGGNPSAFFIIDQLHDTFIVGMRQDRDIRIVKSNEEIDYDMEKILNDILTNDYNASIVP